MSAVELISSEMPKIRRGANMSITRRVESSSQRGTVGRVEVDGRYAVDQEEPVAQRFRVSSRVTSP